MPEPETPLLGSSSIGSSAPEMGTIEVNGFPIRVWRKGSGPAIGFLAGFGGLPRWVPFSGRAGSVAHRDRAVAARVSGR